jgi:death-on-curing protein
MIIYIPYEQALEIHKKTVEKSGGGSYDSINLGYLSSVLELMQNDMYYPEFEDKLTHLIWSINKNHSFSDGNKRLSITLGLQFLSLNGYLYCIKRFLFEMENISYHLAAGNIDKDLLQDIIHSFIENEEDFEEALKFRIFIAMSNGEIDLEE